MYVYRDTFEMHPHTLLDTWQHYVIARHANHSISPALYTTGYYDTVEKAKAAAEWWADHVIDAVRGSE